MPTRKSDGIPRLRIKKGDSLKTIYAKARKAFTADDLAKYAQDEEMVPAEQIIAEMEAIQRKEARKRSKPKKKA
jgi:hypothetical protein